jgi:hypothetical protein
MEEQLELFPRKSEAEQYLAENQIIEEQQTIDYQIREYPIDVIVAKYTDGKESNSNELFIPKYQRKFVWSLKQQSKFIESLMLGLPVPYIYTSDNEGRMEIVDGSQRVRTIEAFLNNKLVLEGLNKLNNMNGFRHKDMLLVRKRRFNKKTIRMIELTEKATIEVRKEMFERINTTPTILKDMEVRKGVYEGKFYEFLQACSENSKFKLLCPISKVKAKRDEGVEMVLRYFAYSDNYQNFDHIVKDFLNDYMKEKQKEFDVEKLDTNFENMLDFVYTHFSNGFKKSENAKSTPRVRFESISVGVNLALQQDPNLIPPSPSNWINSDEFKKHTTSDAANNKKKVTGRIEFVRDRLLGRC